jgi:hypothetical protein
MSDSSIQLYFQLKDFIEIDSPSNEKFHKQRFVIEYIDNSKIKIINFNTSVEELLIINNKTIEDKTIENIYLLSRDETNSYAKQNNLITNTWIDIYFSGNIPFSRTGKIINMEEDMIEIKLYPSEEIIYIDFAYKGIPEDLNINRIQIREKPDELKEREEKQEEEEQEQERRDSSFMEPEYIETGESLISDQQDPNMDNHQYLISQLLDANEIEIGDDLQEITQEVQLSEDKQHHSIFTQTKDLLDELLSEIPTANRTTLVLNKIHLMIERYIQLREQFSTFDNLGNALMPKIKTANHKPLIQKLKNMNQSLFWIKPVVKNLKNVYDIPNADQTDDLINNSYYDSLMHLRNNVIRNRSTTDNYDINQYNIQLNNFCKSFQDTYDNDEILYNTKINENLDCIVDNLDNFFSSTIHNEGKINRKRFLIQKYNTDDNELLKDNLQLKSLLVLPFEYYFYSKINLPGTNILKRTTLEQKQIYNFDIFNNELNNSNHNQLHSIVVNDTNDKNILSKFLKNITEFNYDFSVDDNNKYDNYLQKIIPKTKIIFDKLKKYISGQMSIYNILSYLEPFSIYIDDLTYMQYTEIVKFVREKNSEYIKKYVKNQDKFNELNKVNKYQNNVSQNILYNLLKNEKHPIETDKNLHEVIKTLYDLSDNELSFTSSELLQHYYLYDQSKLHNICSTLSNVHLLDSIDINREIENKNKEYSDMIDNEKKGNTCGQYFLAKEYIEKDELEDDDNKDIFFDKKYDLDERPVDNDHYAVLKEEDTNKEVYYKRINNKWEEDHNMVNIESKQTFFCNIQDKCFQMKKDCNDLSLSESELKHKTIQHILNEFDNKYEISVQELTSYLMTQLNYLTNVIKIKKEIQYFNLHKNDKEQINRGIGITEEELKKPVSPYLSYWNRITKQTDFIKKQTDTIKFVKKYARDPIADESPHWLYCKESNLKLLPSFFYTLAIVFTENKDYMLELEKVKNSRGRLSDDGNAYVDQYSGEVIKYIDTNDDEGYEKGFKINSKEIMEKDQTLTTEENTKLYEDENSRIIINIITSMSNHLSINLNHQYEFIVRNTLNNHEKKIPSKSKYEEQANMLLKKGKKIQSYTDLCNFSLLINTLAFIHIAIQTSIPSIKTKKSFPGKCMKSFDGFPLQLSGSYEGLKYIACVANSIKKNIVPWNTIKKVKEEIILDKLKNMIEKDIITNPIIKEKFVDKQNYINLQGSGDIPTELNIINWTTFLPPLVKVNVTQLQSVSSSFINSLLENIKKGSIEQHEKIDILKSKMMYFSQAIISVIDKIIQKETPILTKSTNEPFLINSCCVQNNTEPILHYFTTKNKEIKSYNEIIKEYNQIVIDSVEIPQAPLYLHDNSTKLKYPKITNEFEEQTIYKAFIKYCRFDDIIPIHPDLQRVCLSKPVSYDKNDNLKANIVALKAEGKIYSKETLRELLKIIGSKNIVDKYNENEHSNITKIRSLLQNISNDEILDASFNELFLNSIDTFELSANSENVNNSEMSKELNDYVYEKNEIIKEEIKDFIKLHSKENIKPIMNFINKFDEWNKVSFKNDITNADDDGSYRIIEYIKNITTSLTITIPNMIINNVDSNYINPKHWNLSENDYEKIEEYANNYLNIFSTFYHTNISELLKKIEQKCQNTLLFQSLLLCFSDIHLSNDKTIKSILNSESCKLLHNYCFLNVMKQFILLSDEEYADKIKSVFNENDIDDFEDENSKQLREEMLLGIKNNSQEQICSLLISSINIFSTYKTTIDVNYNNIMNNVNKSKEKEKREITMKLKDLSDDARKVAFKKKNLKLDEWNMGQQKGLTTYVKDWVDTGEERDYMDLEQPIILEEGEEGEDVYLNDEDKENNDLGNLADDDDYGDNDGDEGF